MIHRLLTIHSLSPMHAGTGQGIAGIDLPIQREKHTGWPCLPGSSIKGVLRDTFRSTLGLKPDDADKDKRTLALFGPEPRGAEHGLGLGALIVGDAVLVLMPVRSLVGTFAWCTSALALQRLQRMLVQAGRTDDVKALEPGLKALPADTVACDAALVADDKKVVLEDHALPRIELPTGVAAVLAKILPPGLPEGFVGKHLAVVPDDLFTWFARHGTQVEARIRLDPATKTVQDGALFYEESLPPEAVLVAPIAAEDARHPDADPGLRSADAALMALGSIVTGTIQFGGKATIGRGQCAVALIGKE